MIAGTVPVLVHNCNTTIYRYQEHADSMRVSVGEDGNVAIHGDGMLHLNMSGDISHSQAFGGADGHIAAFDVPDSYVAQVRAGAIDQRPPSGMSRRQWNIFKFGRAQIDDPSRGADLYGLPSEMFGDLLDNIVPGSGRILPGR